MIDIVSDDEAALIYEAISYQVSKGIGEIATVVNGEEEARDYIEK